MDRNPNLDLDIPKVLDLDIFQDSDLDLDISQVLDLDLDMDLDILRSTWTKSRTKKKPYASKLYGAGLYSPRVQVRAR